eukprot:UC4_evm6s575
MDDEMLVAVFNQFDPENTGFVSLEKFTVVAKSMLGGGDESHEDILEALTLDEDGSGQLSFQQFSAGVRHIMTNDSHSRCESPSPNLETIPDHSISNANRASLSHEEAQCQLLREGEIERERLKALLHQKTTELHESHQRIESMSSINEQLRRRCEDYGNQLEEQEDIFKRKISTTSEASEENTRRVSVAFEEKLKVSSEVLKESEDRLAEINSERLNDIAKLDEALREVESLKERNQTLEEHCEQLEEVIEQSANEVKNIQDSEEVMREQCESYKLDIAALRNEMKEKDMKIMHVEQISSEHRQRNAKLEIEVDKQRHKFAALQKKLQTVKFNEDMMAKVGSTDTAANLAEEMKGASKNKAIVKATELAERVDWLNAYIDRLLGQIMERCPEILENPNLSSGNGSAWSQKSSR